MNKKIMLRIYDDVEHIFDVENDFYKMPVKNNRNLKRQISKILYEIFKDPELNPLERRSIH